MYIVAAHSWKQPEEETAKNISNIMDILLYESRQKISNGGPAILTSFADPNQAEDLASRLSQVGVPALVVDPVETRREQPLHVSHFTIGPRSLQVETDDGEHYEIDYELIELLIVAMCNSGITQTTAVIKERKFSFGKTLLAGGLPMSKTVKREMIVDIIERDKAIWIYARGHKTMIFNRGRLNYEGLGETMQLTRNLNFKHLKTELRRLAPQAGYDDRLLRRAEQVQLLGPNLDPDFDLDLAFDILARCLRPEPAQNS